MFENIRLAFQGIWSHKMRSFLTMLGIIIGIAAIIAIVSTIQGTNEQIKENLIGSGDNTVDVQLYEGDWVYEMTYSGLPSGVPVIEEEVKQQLEDIPSVEEVALYTKRQEYDAVFYKNLSLSGGYILGIDSSFLKTSGYIMQKGRNFVDSDFEKYRKVALLDENSSAALFQGEDPIGKTIEIKKEPYIVVGIIAKAKKFEPTINSMEDYHTYMEDSSGQVLIPNGSWPIVYSYDEPQNVKIKAMTTDDMGIVGKKAAEILNSYLSTNSETMKYKAENILEQAKEIQDLSQSTNKMLLWIASISLLVGGIGVMNIMLVSVTERTSEIGLKKSIGARKTKILGQFLTEAAVLTSLGGVIGVVGGIVLSEVISKLSETPVAISIPAAILGVVFSMIIGIVFGLLPSYKAANLDPIEALRRE